MPHTPPGERLAYKPHEVASLIGRSINYVYTQMRSGSLPTARIGRCRMVLRSDLVKWLEAHREETYTPSPTGGAR